eukprot:Protomagalhaensia_sp_Gyna_25__1421@NODE_1718_length_1589_cov_26_588387_g1407_i0_p1_GENE_NODE_1718_length_1589_cov_26_588387_g1407_i0NODE_1718_length_1589_cov_26_588387_g1407_i0_p1_ORF_typecomplete_len260_score35_16VSNARE_C/PF12352_8/7_8e03VSNARE_C/PF12352_8/2_2e05Sec20/PF03908_13/5_3e02Sec20/PF03908_13/0_00122ph_phosp/PF04029_14/0_018DUF4201/PF13870_6/2e02DUF4201/PF13870_6/67DUF4201/PF13870_6/0_61Helo_like_N/PF17111_5/0_12Helo_like_N/PF17111_5/5_4e02Laminin_II/PF06009_12/1e02Laminin_II/PF06009_1
MSVTQQLDSLASESNTKDAQSALRGQIRALQGDIESNLAILQQARSELTLTATSLSSSPATLSAEKLDELSTKASDASQSIKAALPLLQQCDQELARLAQAPQEYGQLRRFQDITISLVARHRNISTAVDNLLHARRVELLLQKHKDHRDDPEGVTATAAATPQQYLMKEKNALNATIDIIAESIASAKASYSNLSNQGGKLRGAGRTATQMVSQIADINRLMTRIRHLQRRHQFILLVVFIMCLSTTLILTYHRIFAS